MGVVNTTYTFTGTDTITSSKLNNIIDDTTFTSDAISGSSLQIVSPGKLAVAAGGITSNELGANSVTTSKIVDANVTTVKIADANITPAKLSDSDFGAFTVASGVATLDDNSVTTSKITDANITASKLSGAQTGTAPIFGIRAWAKLNILVGASSDRTTAFKSGSYSRTTTETTITGMADHGLKTNDVIRLDFTSGSGTDGLYTVTSTPSTSSFVVNHTGTATTGLVTAQFVKIQGSGNISSATFFDTSNSRVVLNFAIPMPNINYATCGAGHHYPGFYGPGVVGEDTVTGIAQLNTVNQSYIYVSYGDRFASVIILG